MLPQHWLFHPVTICWLIAGVLLSWSISLFVRAGIEKRDEKLAKERRLAKGNTEPLPSKQRPKRTLSSIVNARTSSPTATFSAAVIAFILSLGTIGLAVTLEQSLDQFGVGTSSTHGGLFVLACGLALGAIANIVWGVVGDRSRGRQRCPACWYDMAATPRSAEASPKSASSTDNPTPICVCPECGREVFAEEDLLRARKQRWKIALGIFLLLLGFSSYLVERYQRGGVVAMVPTWALVLGTTQLPDDWFDEDWTINHDIDASLTGRIGARRFLLLDDWLIRRKIHSLLFSDDEETIKRGSRLYSTYVNRGDSNTPDSLYFEKSIARHAVTVLLDLQRSDAARATAATMIAQQPLDEMAHAIAKHKDRVTSDDLVAMLERLLDSDQSMYSSGLWILSDGIAESLVFLVLADPNESPDRVDHLIEPLVANIMTPLPANGNRALWTRIYELSRYASALIAIGSQSPAAREAIMHILEDDTLDNQIQSSVLFPLWNFELHGVLPPSLSELFDRAKESSSPRLRLRIAQLELFSLLSTATEDEPSDDMLQHARVILDCLRQDPNLALLAPGSFGMFLNPELLRENEDVFRVMLTSADIHVRTVAISIVSESISRMGRFQSKERINELTAIYAGWSAVIKEAGMPGPNDQQADADWLKELCDDVVRSLETDSSDAS